MIQIYHFKRGDQVSEVWKDVVGYEGVYEVSNIGRVRTHKNKITYSERHGFRRWKQRILKEKNKGGRDVRITLWKDGVSKDFLVHRLVAFAFIPTITGRPHINHIDGNPRNNNVSNLEWCDHKHNNNHAFDNGLIKTSKKVILINSMTKEKKEFRSYSKASEFLGRNSGYISGLLKKKITQIGDYEIQSIN